MAWPPPVFPSTFTNATNQLDDHPNIHNEINASLNNDFRPKIDDNADRLTANDALIAANAANLADHEADPLPSWTPLVSQDAPVGESGILTGSNFYMIRHGICSLSLQGTVDTGFPGGPVETSSIRISQIPVTPASSWSTPTGYGFVNESDGNVRPCIAVWSIANSEYLLREMANGQSGGFARIVNGLTTFQITVAFRTTAADTV